MKRAFFIIGPESSGTRMMTQAFLSLGMYGDGTHRQRLDKEGFNGGHEMIAIRRSVPHGKIMPAASKLIKRMEKQGYEVYPILIIRDKDMCAKSQVKNKHAKNGKAARVSIRHAVEHIYKELSIVNKSPYVIYYEPFVKFKAVRKAFFQQFGLEEPTIEFYNANLQYKDGKKVKPQRKMQNLQAKERSPVISD